MLRKQEAKLLRLQESERIIEGSSKTNSKEENAKRSGKTKLYVFSMRIQCTLMGRRKDNIVQMTKCTM